MSPRERRLLADHRDLEELALAGRIRFRCEGSPPDRYVIAFEAEGLAPGEDGTPMPQRAHRVACYLHLDYPRQAPLIVWQTPVFHPNVLGPDRHGAVCIGSWSAAESLADLCLRLIDLAGWRSFSANDVLNREAADWATERALTPGSNIHEAVARA